VRDPHPSWPAIAGAGNSRPLKLHRPTKRSSSDDSGYPGTSADPPATWRAVSRPASRAWSARQIHPRCDRTVQCAAAGTGIAMLSSPQYGEVQAIGEPGHADGSDVAGEQAAPQLYLRRKTD